MPQDPPAPRTPSADPVPGSRVSRRGFLSVALLAGGAAGVRSASALTTVRARPADAVADVLGVRVDTDPSKGVYVQRDQVLARLKELGARYVRSRLFPEDAEQLAYLQAMGRQGIRHNLVMGDPNPAQGTPEELVARAATHLPGAIASFEGANEWDLHTDRWVAEVRAHQQRLYRAAKADARVRSVPVIAPSLGKHDRYDDLGSLTSWIDQGNLHLYQGGYVPNYRADTELRAIRQVSGTKPVAVTETGWHNLSRSAYGHNYTPEDVAGIYAPRALLEYFRVGVPRIYLFELCDRTPAPDIKDYQSHFGLVRNDFSRKPVFTSLANLMSLVSDPGPAFTPRSLSYEAKGPADLRQVLLQRRDGRFLLVLWRQASIYDPITRRRSTVAQQSVRVMCPSAKAVRVFRPSGSVLPVTPTGSASKVDLTIGAELAVVEIIAV